MISFFKKQEKRDFSASLIALDIKKISTSSMFIFKLFGRFLILNTPGRVRTSNLRLRGPTLYPIGLRAQKAKKNTPERSRTFNL